MALANKFAAVKDIEFDSPDVYETPELTDDRTSTVRSRSISPISGSEDEDSGVDRRRFDPNEARTRFQPARVDARGVDFSDRINPHKTSYRTSQRRARSGAGSEEEYGDFSDDEESKEHRLSRLRREIAELKEDFDTAESANDTEPTSNDTDVAALEDIERLSSQLDTLYNKRHGNTHGAEADLQASLSRFSKLALSSSQPAQPALLTPSPSTLPPQQQEYLLSLTSSFDTRLASLEFALGLTSLTLPELSNASPRPILSTLDTLTKQLTLITSTTPSSLDAHRRKIQQLTTDAESLLQARRAAKAAAESLAESATRGTPRVRPSVTGEPMTPGGRSGSPTKISGGGVGGGMSYIEDPERVAKINALYGTLENIESLAPTLPLVLERLRTLRLVHSSAGEASQALDEMEKRQASQAEELREWRRALEGMEGKMGEGEEVLKSNVEHVGTWVRELEERVKKFG